MRVSLRSPARTRSDYSEVLLHLGGKNEVMSTCWVILSPRGRWPSPDALCCVLCIRRRL